MTLRPIHRFATERPLAVIVIATILVLLLAPGLGRLRLRTDGNALVPSSHPAILEDRQIREEFSIGDEILIAVDASRRAEGIYNPHTLQTIADLTERVSAVDNIDGRLVTSLATERGIRVIPGTLIFRRLLDPVPQDPEDVARLRDDVHRIGLYIGTLVSSDDSTAAILVSVSTGADRHALVATLLGIVQDFRGGTDRIHIVGAPIAESLLGHHLMQDLGMPTAILGDLPIADDAGDDALVSNWFAIQRAIARSVGLLPVAIALMAVVFLVSFRRPIAALLPLLEVGACLLIVFAIMGWMGVPVYLTTAVMPVMLTAVGIADEIHLFNRYRQLARTDSTIDRRALVERTMDEMTTPIVRTSLTSGLAFLTFALSPIDAVRWFGIFTAAGIFVCLAWSLTVIPACLILLPTDWLVPPGTNRSTRLADLATAVTAWCGRRRRLVLIVAAAVAITAGFGVARVQVQDSWIEGFAPDSPFRRVTDMVNDRFLGTHILRVCVDAPSETLRGDLLPEDVHNYKARIQLPASAGDVTGQWLQITRPGAEVEPGFPPESRTQSRSPIAEIESVARLDDGTVELSTAPIHGTMHVTSAADDTAPHRWRIDARQLVDPQVMQAIQDLHEVIAVQDANGVGGVIGPGDFLATTAFITSGALDESRRAVPEEAHRIVNTWKHYHSRSRTPQRPRTVINASHSRAIMSVFLKNANFAGTAEVMQSIDRFARERLAPLGISIRFAGDVAVSQTLIAAIVSTQVRSLLLSLLAVLIVTALLHRSILWGLACVLPCACAVLVNYAVMGYLGIPLGVATSMFSAMTIGIGVDFAIHLSHAYRSNATRGAPAPRAMADAAAQAGPALIVDAAAIILGFGILTLSQVPANARLGGLVALSVVGCLFATLVLLPAIIANGKQSP